MYSNFTATETKQYKSIVLLLLVLNLLVNGVQASPYKELPVTNNASISNGASILADYQYNNGSIHTTAKLTYKQVSQYAALYSEELTTKLMVTSYHCKHYHSFVFSLSPPDIIYPFHSFW